ncbi:HAMP domain-containing histidine kinase [Clostridium sp. MSJ-11]|uniref:histidine kinase n=1 Tax=Clostridium mobile TaxID=2841512 RepID=A0ABS6EDY9_9CLOT|nr:HAMP domain-containing sensor histidine kinase [Clostridium mobile]MBU5483421.1 HAMP domain-containing histidine kinase [Clostridium mobile]
MNNQRRLTAYFLPRTIILLLLSYFVFLSPLSLFNLLLKHENNPISEVFVSTIIENTIIQNEKVIVKQNILDKINQEDMWLQILNAEGYEIFQFNRPKDFQIQYAPGELILEKNNNAKNEYMIFTGFKNIQGQKLTWIVGQHNFTKDKLELILIILGMILAAIFASMLFSKWIGKPLAYILFWLQQLSKGAYLEENTNNITPIYENKNGKIKRPYIIYKEVIFALNQLTLKLRENEKERKELDKLREEWITSVSHDIKTPLSVLKGYADLLATDTLVWNEKEVSQFVSIIQDRSCYIEELVNDFNLIFRLKNNDLPINKNNEDVIELLRECMIDITNTSKGKKQYLNFYSNDEELFYPVDKKLFKRAIDNLLVNAVMHNPEKTTVELKVCSFDNKSLDKNVSNFQIIIQDDGIGMDSRTQRHLFERYYRGTDSSSDVKGTGLGMAIAQQLIYAHKGEISVSSAPKKGTKITITLG